MKKLDKVYRGLLYVLPVALFFSYYPVMKLGENDSMYFELSLTLLWVVVFDIVALIMMVRRRALFVSGVWKRIGWVLFPVWACLSVLWSENMLRGVLTAGVLLMVCFAGYGIWRLRGICDKDFWRKWWQWFVGTTIVICLWCVVQCVLDLVGVGQEWTLLCDGCTYRMFGFPHPNGFAIEPQFMGNLLLAPTIVEAGWLMLRLRPRSAGPSPRAADANSRAAALRNVASSKHHAILFFMFASTIFLTFSRGAIYAFVVGLFVMSGLMVINERQKWQNALKRAGIAWGVVILSFGVCLNVQGLMAEFSPTSDTYADGVAKVINHLSLGVIDIRGGAEDHENVAVENSVEKPVENTVDNVNDDRGEGNKPVFDGYVAESTDTRLRLTGAAVEVWSSDLRTVLFGVGLGGAGQALFEHGLSPAPREIVQNEYASLLLETGLIGVSLFALMVVWVFRMIWRSEMRGLVVPLVVAYAVTLLFFSGLPNALQIYLLPVVFATAKKING
ncbi:O-antigen ligase family protein [Candidatus Saccharibacteria bacterium]|nr:O-antigen ligase family protein [Candidatus Saccharibacteria bacterium]